MVSKRPFPMLLLLAALAVLPGCPIYDQDPELRVFWEFAGARSCVEAGVEDVLVEVVSGNTLVSTGFLPCELGFVDIDRGLDRGGAVVTVLAYPPPPAGPTWVAERGVDLRGGFNTYTFVLVPLR